MTGKMRKQTCLPDSGVAVRWGLFYEGPVTMRQRLLQIIDLLKGQGAQLVNEGHFYRPENLPGGLTSFPLEKYAELILKGDDWLYSLRVKNLLDTMKPDECAAVFANPFNNYLAKNQQIIHLEMSDGRAFDMLGPGKADPAHTLKVGQKIYENLKFLVTATHPAYASIGVEFGETLTINELKSRVRDPWMFNNFYFSPACLTPKHQSQFLDIYHQNGRAYQEVVGEGIYLSTEGPFNPRNMSVPNPLRYAEVAGFFSSKYRV